MWEQLTAQPPSPLVSPDARGARLQIGRSLAMSSLPPLLPPPPLPLRPFHSAPESNQNQVVKQKYVWEAGGCYCVRTRLSFFPRSPRTTRRSIKNYDKHTFAMQSTGRDIERSSRQTLRWPINTIAISTHAFKGCEGSQMNGSCICRSGAMRENKQINIQAQIPVL